MTQRHGNKQVQQFIDDDPGYLAWLEQNPHGFVVNSARTPSPAYLVLHWSGCSHINSPNRTNWTTTGYIKTCSNDVRSLEQWAQVEIRGGLHHCAACKPGGNGTPVVESLPKSQPAADSKPGVGVSTETPSAIPAEISTGCLELDLAWQRFATFVLDSHILIPDTDDDLNWHAFLGHSLDMQGFRAAEFVGVDPLTRNAPGFVPLKERGIGIRELAQLWNIGPIRDHLTTGTKGLPLDSTLQILRVHGGEVGRSLADAFDAFPFRKGHWTVRAYFQNSAVLADHGYSFRNWLKAHCAELGETEFPPRDFRRRLPNGLTLESTLRQRLISTFYQVGDAISPYMICDWQLWLWREGKTEVFANFKLDSFHEQFVGRFGNGIVPAAEAGFADWWLSLYPTLPPRLANECIWLGTEKGTFGS